MNSSIVLLVLTLLSSIGDTIFLVGLPLHLYKTTNQSFASTTLISILIYLTVFLFGRLIIKINSQKNPLEIVAFGEISMGVVELITLVIYFVTKSELVLILAVVPLALIYNLYAVPKFFEIQDFFHKGEVVKFTSLISFFREAGVFLGVIIGSFLIQYHSIFEVLLVDAASFILYGVILLMYRNNTLDRKSFEQTKTKTIEDTKGISSLRHFLIVSSISGFFLAWQQSSSIPVVNHSFHLPFDQISIFRTIAGLIGLALGVIIINLNFDISKIWKNTACMVLVFIFGSYFVNSYVVVFTLFLVFGLLKSTTDAAKKSYYLNCKAQDMYPNLAAVQWTVESLSKISLIPLALAMDAFAKGTEYTLLIYIVSLFISGALTGMLNHVFIKKKYYQ